jgi:hypothetical protein
LRSAFRPSAISNSPCAKELINMIRADLKCRTRGYGTRPQDKTYFRKRITPFAVIVHRSGRWVYSVKVPVFCQLMTFIYLVVNTVCLAITGIHAHRESDIGPGLVIRNCNAFFLLAPESATVAASTKAAASRAFGAGAGPPSAIMFVSAPVVNCWVE